MKSIKYIIPYFGKLPSEFMPMWLKSASTNQTVNWLILTDDQTSYNYPVNVEVKYCTFDDIVKRIQSIFDFKISLNKPYNLCDYKVTYGEVFAEELKGYDFWGYCDLDICWGDIRSIITDDILERFEKIGFRGHSTLYKNNPEVNSLYRKGNYKDYFTDPTGKNHGFDEIEINELANKNGYKQYMEVSFANITALYWNFQLSLVSGVEKIKNKHRIFAWENGHLFSYSLLENNIVKEEYYYVHFLRRRMYMHADANANNVLIVPNEYVNYVDITKKVIEKYSKEHIIKYWLELFSAKWRKISIKKVINYFIYRRRATKNFLSK